jgi:UDP-N-acetyl-D-glucosamine dehydrogenase
VLGVSYKRDVSDIRESPALEIIQTLLLKGALVSYHDPFVPLFRSGDVCLDSVPLVEERLKEAHCVVILTDHTSLNYPWIVGMSTLIVDTRNATDGIQSQKIRKL